MYAALYSSTNFFHAGPSALSAMACGRCADDVVALLALRPQHCLVDGDRAADQRGGSACLLVLGQEVHAVGSAKRHIDGVDFVGNCGNDGGEVLVADRHPEFLRHMTACLAEIGHKAEHLGVGEGIILRDSHDRVIALVLVCVLTESRHPLCAVGGEAIEVRRGIAQGRVLRGGGAVDKSDVRLSLGVVLDRNAFVARERPDQDLDAVLLDELARGLDCAVRRRVGRALDDFDLLAAGGVVRLLEGELGAAHPVLAEHGERALEGRKQSDLDRDHRRAPPWARTHCWRAAPQRL